MRIIDADALVEEIVRINDLRRLSTATIGKALDAVPTIDAIPVEWLNKQCEIADDRGDMEMTDAIGWLIQTWQEEQEAMKNEH